MRISDWSSDVCSSDLEAEKELSSDLRHATDREDRWDAWDEWTVEVVDADKDYVKEMREKGYRTGRATVGGSRPGFPRALLGAQARAGVMGHTPFLSFRVALSARARPGGTTSPSASKPATFLTSHS